MHASLFCSLSQLVRWMGMKAEELGVEIYPGFAAKEVFIQVLSSQCLSALR